MRFYIDVMLSGMGIKLLIAMVAFSAFADERAVDPTWLRRNMNQVKAVPDDLSAAGCQWLPMFGAGDDNSKILRGVARFGRARLAAASSCATDDNP